MYPRHSLAEPGRVEELTTRLGRVESDASRRWGRMTSHEMLCHLADAFDAVLDRRELSHVDTWFQRTVIKYVALHTPIPWPKGVPTRPEVDPRRAGTRPSVFGDDRARAIRGLREFAAATAYGRHPVFGHMSREEWLLWGFGHTDHHLRQFGL